MAKSGSDDDNKPPMSSDLPTSPCEFIEGELRLAGGLNERLFGLLASIDSTGSINRSARLLGLSYKGAWEMVERANNLAPKVLVTTATGGRHGGGTSLTAAGKALLALFSSLQKEHRQFLHQLNQRLADDPETLFLLRRIVMKASARNQYYGKVTAVDLGAVTAEVEIGLKGGDKIVASVTKTSAAALGIQEGADVVALIKAPHIMIVTDLEGYRLSARNQLRGTVARIHKGAVNCEVVIDLVGGNSIAATITNESADALGLAVGGQATAVFKAGAVILGVAT